MSKKRLGYVLGALLAVSFAGAAQGGIDMKDPNVSHHDRESIRKGAEHFAQYCMGCHSVEYLRYDRVAEDTGMGEEWIEDKLIFDDDIEHHEQMISPMDPEDGENWFGIEPPDLSMTTRVHGEDWVYTFLHAYFKDEDAAVGFDNWIQEGTSMPHVLAHLQGTPKPVHDDDGNLVDIEVSGDGEMSRREYEAMTAELTAFLAYAAEPIRADRERMGIWVILFLLVMTTVFYLLYKEYWRELKKQ
ncbi:cytochrome c1 [Halorhodospira halochloris]|uniref:Ubiquinol cytochrome C oxidoreductase n=1 Tax=Halorhodospira halochloris TaxID=1052 RepID=A0A110B798_HALHR|nr:cytochrome c1 [Halorhodospira halochloris]MBK1651664.1 hypothetical protein [Halorhodospira halochloris]MCG5529586.1 cytochrome c1 [Halorhodospira halochloris]MCG5548135.1 cytochrome c1 [Halorhodospira halochloris]BAU58528.1 ubiquinol cytochrome C oxidoreductase [Halorhodospira halochloris]